VITVASRSVAQQSSPLLTSANLVFTMSAHARKGAAVAFRVASLTLPELQ